MTNGRIIIPYNSRPSDKELRIAKILTTTGKDVEFIAETIIKTPDIKFEGKLWEIKRPEGNGKRTIQHQIQRAALQSDNIILDTSGTNLSIEEIKTRIKEAIEKTKKPIKNIIIITKSRKKPKILTIIKK